MKTRISTTIEAGDLVSHGGKLWVASDWDKTRPCFTQCAMFGVVDGCRGYCFRWENTEDVVFKDIPEGVRVSDASEIVETPDLIGERLRDGDGTAEQRAKRKYYEKVKAKREEEAPLRKAKAKTKGWGQGSVTKVHGQFRADFYINGNHLHYASADIAEVEAWLADMNKKKAALKELERMKKS